MKLLFDQNTSPRLPRRVADLFPGSAHVEEVGLDRAEDDEVWRFAKDNAFTLVIKDTDFADMTLVRGAPPKVIWVRLGNCTTDDLEGALRGELAAIEHFAQDSAVNVLIIQ